MAWSHACLLVSLLCVAVKNTDSSDAPTISIILDDHDHSGHNSPATKNAEPGSYAPCLKDAYDGQFLHDWGRMKGEAEAVYTFDPPKTGCYSIEEYHPGSDDACSRYLPKNTRLDVDYCMGKHAVYSVDQSTNGGEFNSVTYLPFYEGTPGALKLSNSQDEKCAEPPCFWVADAFRLTLVGSSCPSQAEQETMTKPMESERHGTVTLRVSSKADGLRGSQSLKDELTSYTKTMEDVLGEYLNYGAVSVLSLMPASGRRLADTETAFQIRFLATDPKPSRVLAGKDLVDSPVLAQALQTSLQKAGAGLTIVSADLAWDQDLVNSSPVEQTEPLTTMIIVIAVAGKWLVCAGLVIVCAGLGIFVACRRRQQTSTVPTVVKAAQKNEEVGLDDVELAITTTDDGELAAKKKEEDDVASVSTAPPASEEQEVRSEEDLNPADGI